MKLKDIMESSVAALVEYYDDTEACAEANALVERVKEILGADAPVYRVDVDSDPREAELARVEHVPTIIIYRNRRREWIIMGNWPTAQELASRLEASSEAPGAVNPLKGHPRH